jgi:hypothetical protein
MALIDLSELPAMLRAAQTLIFLQRPQEFQQVERNTLATPSEVR